MIHHFISCSFFLGAPPDVSSLSFTTFSNSRFNDKCSVLESTSTSRSKTFCGICLRSVFYILFKLQEALQAMFKIILFHARDLYLDVVIFPREPPENLYKNHLKLF